MKNHIKLTNRCLTPRRVPQALLCGAALLVSAQASAQADDEIFELSPFTVDASEDKGYRATNTLAGTRIRTDLKNVGSAISVVTEEFLKDTAATDSQSLLVYTTSTEVGGIGGNFAGGSSGGRVDTDEQRLSPQKNTRVRGLASADNTRDYFLTDIPWDSYIVNRVDMQRGPNSVLFGLGSPAGIINTTINAANFSDQNTIEARMGSYGSWRFSADINRELIDGELGFRFAALSEDTKFRQDPAFEKDERLFGALRWDPKFLNGGEITTSLKINYESGSIDANRPRVTPPIDRITPWFTDLNQATYDARTINDQNTGAINGSSPAYQPWVDGAASDRFFDGPAVVFGDNNSGVITDRFMGARRFTVENLTSQPWWVYRGINSFNQYVVKANNADSSVYPDQSLGVYKSKTLADPRIFDFYNILLDGPNKKEWQDFDAYNLSFSQNFLNNRLGYELAFDHQEYEEGQLNYLSGSGQAITVDIMSVLPDGRQNLNAGRAMVVSDSGNNNRNLRQRESFRGTIYGELDFTNSDNSFVSNLLGRHVFTGVYSTQESDEQRYNWVRYAADNDFAPAAGAPITQGTRSVVGLSYLGGDLTGRSISSGLGIPGIQAIQSPTSGSLILFDETYLGGDPANVASYKGFTSTPLGVWNADQGDINNLYKKGSSKSLSEVDSKAFVWQAFLLNGTVVPSFGYREDESTSRNAGSPPQLPGEIAQVFDPSWSLPRDATDVNANTGKTYNFDPGISKTYSLVVHTPQFIKEKLPAGLDFSLFYNESENFEPDASRRDLFGQPIGSPSGNTKDYGFVVSAMNNQFVLKVNRYETSISNSTLSGQAIDGSYLLGAGEAWGYMFSKWAEGGYGDFSRNYALVNPDDASSGLIDQSVPVLRYQPRGSETVSQAKARETAALNFILNTGNRPPADFVTNWGIGYDAFDPAQTWGSQIPWSQPSGLAVTGDTLSKGTEFELMWNPKENWNIAVNASKTSASRLNIAKSYADWVEDRWELYQGPLGDVQLWNGGNTQETIRSKFANEFMGPYSLFRLQENGDVPELRPWRFNLVTNYTFNEGGLNGLNIGGSLRWQDEIIVGYPVKNSNFDLANPYYGGTEDAVDLWAGYEFDLTDKIRWRIQLNIRNAFSDGGLIPISVQPDGTPGTSRIADERNFLLTNTFNF